MSNRQVNKSRRVLLNTTLGLGALGMALPSSWTKPIVSAVMLPAHAQTSVPSFDVAKTQSGGPSPATLVGDVIEYSIVVTNTGGVDLTGVVTTDTMPDGSTVILTSPVESIATDGVLQVNETWTYATSYTVTETDIMSGAALTNSVSVVTNEEPTPQVDSVDTPVVPVVCPVPVIGNVVVSNSGSGAVVCSLNFDVLSSDSTVLTVTGIINTALSAGAAVAYETFPVDVTDAVGTRVTWTGILGTPECVSFATSDVVFSVTVTCDGALEPVVMNFNLAEIAALA